MNDLLAPYKALLGPTVIDKLFQLAHSIKGIKVVHINSTYEGGGVAEILTKMVPLMNALGIQTSWEVINGDNLFFQSTKLFHNILQGMKIGLPLSMDFGHYEKINAENAERLKDALQDADVVFVHDPQPLPLINYFPNHKGKWIWRCHIDVTYSPRNIWKYFKKFIEKYDASIFSLEDFVRRLPHPIYLIPPSIDPLSDKNIELEESEIRALYNSFKIDFDRPKILQVSRFDRFKDPVGVIHAYQLAKKYSPSLQLILAGGGATDDPESEVMLQEVKSIAANDPDIHVLFLPPANRQINALQRGADIILQKSIREGFGLTVTEGLWKAKPVIGGNTGGIRLQLFNHYSGFLVNTPEGAALRIRNLLQNPHLREELGKNGKHLVKDNFLITRHIGEYFTLICALLNPDAGRIDLSKIQQ